MSESQTEFRQLVIAAANGDDDAFKTIVDKYGRAIQTMASKRLTPKLRRHYDSDDVFQTVLKSFFADREQLDRFETPEDLQRFLYGITHHKLVEKYRRKQKTQSYNLDREPAMTDLQEEHTVEALADTPTPSQIVSAKEKHEEILDGQPDHIRDVIDMRTRGAKFEEIAEATGMNERSIRRMIRRLEDRVKR